MQDEQKTKAQLIDEAAKLRQEIQEHKIFAENLIENSAVATFVLDSQHRVVIWNKACEELTGVPASTMIGTDNQWKAFYDHARPVLADIVIDDDFDKLPELYPTHAKSTLTPNALHAEGWYGDLNGKDRYILFDAAPIYDTKGELIAVSETLQDVTESRRAEETIEQQLAFLQKLIDTIPSPIFYKDSAGRYLGCNIAFEAFLGKSREGIVGKTVYDIAPKDLADVYYEADLSLFRKQGVQQYESPVQYADGSRREVLFTKATFSDLHGKVAGLVGVMVDITESKRAEESLRQNENTLRAITGTATDAIIMIDDKGAIVYWNPAAKRILGFSADEAMGKDITLIIPYRYREAHKKAFNRFIETGRVARIRRTYEIAALKKDGAEVPVELSISGLRLKGRCYSVGIVRDISERTKLEDQLRQSQKMEAVGQLAGGIAHDFNNILSAIIGYGHLLRMKMQEDDPLRTNVEHLLEAADRAAHLTHSLLAFSRKQVLIPRPVDLKDVITGLEKLLRRVMGKDVELTTSFGKAGLTVHADAGQIDQVLLNLATNARDAMPHGGVVAITADRIELDKAFIQAHGYGEVGSFAVVSVTDSGTGMDEETKKRIFEPFFTTKELGRGTGLGLSIIYGIVKQHRGYINVYSELGKGTVFRIYLPLIETEKEKTRTPGDAPEEVPLRGTETVLVADDDEALRKLLRTLLEEAGYRVITAKDGADAVSRFLKNRDSIQLVILDMIMPEKNGREAYEEIRAIKPGIKGIFISGYTADTMQLEGIAGAGVELLLKPVLPTVLINKVREVLDKGSP